MPVSTNRAWNMAFEALYGVANTSEGKQAYEESIPFIIDIHPSNQFGQPIPAVPPTLAIGESNGLMRKRRIPLTRDNSTPTGWIMLETWKSGWSAGSRTADDILISTGIGKSYGDGYAPTLWGGVSGATQIFLSDDSSPLILLRSGVVTTETARPETGASLSSTLYLEFYDYEGQTLLDRINQTNAAWAFTELSGTRNDINKAFTASVTFNEYRLIFNGLELSEGSDYTRNAQTFTLLHIAPDADDLLGIHYR